MKAPPYLARFDSASAMAMSLGRVLRGVDFPGLGIMPDIRPLPTLMDALLRDGPRLSVYSWAGALEAAKVDSLAEVDAEAVSRWMVSQYPERDYPAIMIGSSNGAAIHICAAMGIPWLPQTFLIPVRHPGLDPDDVAQHMEWAREPGRKLLEANPDLQLHHMHDANNDRLMIQHMLYFRVKRLRLGKIYREFIRKHLKKGGDIILLECGLEWPTTRIADRHVFQHGGFGGCDPDEYIHGSKRVSAFLKRYGVKRDHWDTPPPDESSPEAEWGFLPDLRKDINKLADSNGYRVQGIAVDKPEQLSPVVADFYSQWYSANGIPANSLSIESFIVMEPFLTMVKGLVPFWMVFNTERSADSAEDYIDRGNHYDNIYLTLFANGIESIGLAPIERWRSLVNKATHYGTFVGVNEEMYPKDFGVFLRYNQELKRLANDYPALPSISTEEISGFIKSNDYSGVRVTGSE